MDLIERATATQKTVDRFKGREFIDGKSDCMQLVITHARHCGKKIVIPAYGDVASAARVLRQLGFSTLGEAMDFHFKRIPPHEAMLGDYIEVPGLNGFTSLSVYVGNGRVLGFHEDVPFADILQPLLITGAWTIE